MEIGGNICRLTRAFYAFDTLQNTGFAGNPPGLPIWFNPAGYPVKPDPVGYPTTHGSGREFNPNPAGFY